MFFTIFICGVIFLYKYTHLLLYPSSRSQIFKKFYPTKNSADTIHLFGRIIGIGIIFTQFTFQMSDGIFLALLDFFILSITTCILYLGSIYIMESIVLYNFEYVDEIHKKKNIPYAVISFTFATGLAYILKSILLVSQHSIILFLFLWLFSLVIIGFACKGFKLFSQLSFNKLLTQKSMALALSYMGFIWGWAIIISSSITHDIQNMQRYIIFIIIKILLALIIFPIFKKGIIFIFRLQDDHDPSQPIPEIGYGLYEGATFFASCFLTTIITGQIKFGTFYPVF